MYMHRSFIHLSVVHVLHGFRDSTLDKSRINFSVDLNSLQMGWLLNIGAHDK